MKVTNPRLLARIPQIRGQGHEALSKAAFRQVFKRKAPKPTHLKMLAGQVMTNVFIHTTTSDTLPPSLVKESGRRGRIAKAMVSIDDLPRLANDSRVRFVELGNAQDAAALVSTATVSAPTTPRAKTTSAARQRAAKT